MTNRHADGRVGGLAWAFLPLVVVLALLGAHGCSDQDQPLRSEVEVENRCRVVEALNAAADGADPFAAADRCPELIKNLDADP